MPELHKQILLLLQLTSEETALLNSLEGGRGIPRLKPPFPAIKGLYGRKTLLCPINSVKGWLGVIKICALKLRYDSKKLE